VAIISGAAQGIGRRTAEVLAERGYSLALNDLRSPAETRRPAEERGAKVMEFVSDVSDEKVVTRFAGILQKKWGRVDALRVPCSCNLSPSLCPESGIGF
jgi:NAD(P)-dependent dehydrogenase (short-subunit alcohol dehydrogenase family)